MPITSVIIVAAIIFAFLAFMVILAWGDHQTRNIGGDADRHAGTRAQVQSLKEAAEAADCSGVRAEAKTS